MKGRNLFLSLILHLGNLFLIVQLHISKLFLILKSGVNHTSRGSISTSTLPSIKLRKCSSKISTSILSFIFCFQAEDGIRDHCVTGVQTCALPISPFAEAVVRKREEPAAKTHRCLLDRRSESTPRGRRSPGAFASSSGERSVLGDEPVLDRDRKSVV